MQVLKGKTVLITGGTGSFGRRFVSYIVETGQPKKVIVFSRDELKQSEMREQGLNQTNYPCLRYFIGDVRDRDRLQRAFSGVEIVVHAAAMKQVPACEYNPDEAIKTNILGALNVRDAALESSSVKKVLALGSDKGVAPLNLYGATKLCAEKLFVQANRYVGRHIRKYPRFSCMRYGNVIGSRGSVIPLFQKRAIEGTLPITNWKMTRFWLTLDQAVSFVICCLDAMLGGEVFVPKIPSMKVVDVATAILPDAALTIVGIRPGEKLHETLLSADEMANVMDVQTFYVLLPQARWSWLEYWRRTGKEPKITEYTSDTNDKWLTIEEMRDLICSTMGTM